MRFTRDGKTYAKTFGSYPEMGLDEARRRVKDVKLNVTRSFESISAEWYKLFTSVQEHSAKHLATIKYRLGHYINPAIGDMLIWDIKRPDLARFLNGIVQEGHLETARRVSGIIGQVFQYAETMGYIETNPAINLRKAIIPVRRRVNHFAHLTNPKEIGALIAGIRKIKSERTRTALLLAAFCFPRCGEILKSTPQEFDFRKKLWTIPAEHTKKRREMCIPLAPEVISFLQPFVKSRRAFPLVFDQKEAALLRVLSNIAKRSGGRIPKVTIHGFRHTASTVLYSQGYNTLWIESALAHVDNNRIRGVYNSYEFLKERRKMLCDYAKWLVRQEKQAEKNSAESIYGVFE